jgi:hypothetical protein
MACPVALYWNMGNSLRCFVMGKCRWLVCLFRQAVALGRYFLGASYKCRPEKIYMRSFIAREWADPPGAIAFTTPLFKSRPARVRPVAVTAAIIASNSWRQRHIAGQPVLPLPFSPFGRCLISHPRCLFVFSQQRYLDAVRDLEGTMLLSPTEFANELHAPSCQPKFSTTFNTKPSQLRQQIFSSTLLGFPTIVTSRADRTHTECMARSWMRRVPSKSG